MSQDPVDPLLPSTLIKDLLPKLARVMEIGKGEMDSRQGSQLIFEATNDFRASMAKARELAESLPGGDMSLSDQDEVLEMLFQLKESKRAQLALFAELIPVRQNSTSATNHMDVDSTASTPMPNQNA